MNSNLAVPLLDLRPQYKMLREQLAAAIARVCDSQGFILGPEVEAFEREILRHTGTEHAVAVSSGTDALILALMSLGIGPGDEVIVPPFTFFASAGSIARVGATPVFADIDPADYNVSPAAIEAAITPRTKAIMPVHLFGQCAALDEIADIAKRYELHVIEDAAQAIGARCNSTIAGSAGTVGCFSFFPSKNLGAFGDAGLVATNNAGLAERMRTLRVHGAEERYFHRFVGGNFRIDAIQAAVLRVKLQHLDRWTEGRRRNAAIYAELFQEAKLSGAGGPVALPETLPGRHHIFNQFVIRCEERDRLKGFLDSRGIGNAIYYPLPLHLQLCFRSSELGIRSCKEGAFPHSERAAGEVLALPIFPELERWQLALVVEAIADFYTTRSSQSGMR